MMQQQTEINNTSTRHVKVSYKGEFRRFALPSLKFTQLEETLRTLYNLGSSSFKIKFQDDESDWVVMSTDEELKYAVELTGNPIRIAIDDVQPVQAVEQKQAFGSVVASPEVTVHLPEEPTPDFSAKGFGKGRGRGGYGGGKGKHHGPIVLERLQMKQEHIGFKIASLEEELETPELSSERERVLLWRLEKLKKKLVFVEKRKQAVESGINESSDVPDGEQDFAADGGWKKRGGCGRGRFGRGAGPHGPHGHHGHHGRKGKKFFRDLPPMEEGDAREAIKNFAKAKADLESARNSGDMHAIVTCERAFKQAKHQKKLGKCVLLAPYRTHKRECVMNLKKAKHTEDEAQMKACEEALVEAIVAIRKAKAELTA